MFSDPKIIIIILFYFLLSLDIKKITNTRKSAPIDFNWWNLFPSIPMHNRHVIIHRCKFWNYVLVKYYICLGFLRTICSLQIICNRVEAPDHPHKKKSAKIEKRCVSPLEAERWCGLSSQVATCSSSGSYWVVGIYIDTHTIKQSHTQETQSHTLQQS